MLEHIISAEQARRMSVAILTAAGASDDIAATVADHLTESDLRGVSSHGLIRLARYVDQIESGHISPRAEVTVSRDHPSHVHLDGGGGFGIVTLREATRRAVEKAKYSTVAAATVVNCAHTGRVGEYVENAAREGCFAMVFGGGGYREMPTVAPHGGAKGVYDTNPYALAMPGPDGEPIVTDFASSATAQGKLLVHRTAKKPVPEGWLIDADGNPSTDPEVYYNGGALLPAGAHKGYGLAVIAELMGDAMLGEPHEFNWMLIVFHMWAVRPRQAYGESAARLLDTIRAVPPAEGFDEVLLPGEPESRLRAERLRQGIPIPDGSWNLIAATAGKVGLSMVNAIGA